MHPNLGHLTPPKPGAYHTCLQTVFEEKKKFKTTKLCIVFTWPCLSKAEASIVISKSDFQDLQDIAGKGMAIVTHIVCVKVEQFNFSGKKIFWTAPKIELCV